MFEKNENKQKEAHGFKNSAWLDSNPGPFVPEVPFLPTVPQPLQP